jgi:hypothetical protein
LTRDAADTVASIRKRILREIARDGRSQYAFDYSILL